MDWTERHVLPFQDFVKRTPPLDHAKPLPPTPLIPRRSSSGTTSASGTPPPFGARRSSSVYSRTASQWGGDGSSWHSSEFSDESLPPLPALQPLAYSASTPHLAGMQPDADVLKPRTYTPLIVTPSPSETYPTAHGSPSQAPIAEPMPAFPRSPAQPKKPIQTVSLAQAKAGRHNLLPEELRAQNLGRSRSHEPLRVGSAAIFEGKNPPDAPDAPNAPTLVDPEGRHRSLLASGATKTWVATNNATGYPFPITGVTSVKSEQEIRGDNSRTKPRSLSTQRRAQADRSSDERRGRARTRRSDVLPPHDARPYPSSGLSPLAQQYRTLLPQQRQRPSRESSEDSISSHMRLVPQPLFRTKPPAKLPGAFGASGRELHVKQSEGSGDKGSVFSRRLSNGSSKSTLPFGLSVSPASSLRRRSTSGSIPIMSAAGGRSASITKSSTYNSENKHDSGYYPFVLSRKRDKSRAGSSTASESPPPAHMWSAANRSRPKYEQGLREGAASERRSRSNGHRRFSNGSDNAKPGLFQRVAKGAAKYADLLTSPGELPDRQYKPVATARVTPDSPHLLLSLVRTVAPSAHLGWSDRSKAAFDETRTSIQSPRRLLGHPQTPAMPEFTHIAAPARPLDDSGIGLRDDMPRRKNSIFGGVLDVWKERKANERREELKKVIKVLPNGDGSGPPNLNRRSSTFNWM